ncbi:hypothetical protein KUV57_11125 [Epibacterium sp. DP7N7-1]|nr:hypothetical protein [Epibacterium sp. DP7N7-1]
MDKNITISLSLKLGNHVSKSDEIAERMRSSLEEMVKSGGLGIEPHDELADWKLSATVGRTVAQTLAPLETWEERQRRIAIEDEGATSEKEIEEHIHAAQKDIDYLEDQDSIVERLISAARRQTGFTPERSELDPEGEGLEP